MPGLSAIAVPAVSMPQFLPTFDRMQQRMLHQPQYNSQTLLARDGVLLGFTAYDSYPRFIFENNSYFVLVEGLVYNMGPDRVRDALIEMAPGLPGQGGPPASLTAFLEGADGEFLAVVYDKERQVLSAFNDIGGRLPVYYHAGDGRFFLSREVKFILPFLESPAFDRRALVEYVLFGNPLGERTPIAGVNRLPPATLVQADQVAGEIRRKVIVPVDLENRIETAATPGEQIRDLKELFLGGLASRVAALGERRPVIALSGGLDSRATLAGLVALGQAPAGVCHVHKNQGEEQVAAGLAGEFGIDFTTLALTRTMEAGDFARLAMLKDGLNPTSLAPQLDFMQQTLDSFGHNIAIFTGMYGGELFRYFDITSGLASVKSLADFLLKTPDKFRYSVKNTCDMLSISRDELLEDLKEHISRYPEGDIYRKYKHFKFEIDYRWAGEGEDRWRFFAWEMTPYFAAPFRSYVTSIDEARKNTLFFRNFLFALDPRTCSVPYYNDGSSMNNIRRLRLMGLAEAAVRRPAFRRVARLVFDARQKIRSPAPAPQESRDIRELLLDLLAGTPSIPEFFSPEKTRRVIEEENDPAMLHRLLTIFLYMKSYKADCAAAGADV